MEPVEFDCTIAKVQNLQTQGGYRLTLDIPSTCMAQAGQLVIHADQPGLLIRARLEEVEGTEQKDQGAYGL